MGGPSHLNQDEYLTVSQACELAAIGRTTFYKLLGDPQSGLADIATRVPGLGYIRISRWKLRKWLEGAPLRSPEENKEKSLDPCPRRGMSQGDEAESGQEEEANRPGKTAGARRARARRPRVAAP